MGMLCTANIDMGETISKSDIMDFLTNAAWAICSTYYTMLKAYPGTTIFGWDMLFDVPFVADLNKIGSHRQCQMDPNTARENNTHVEWDYKIGDKVPVKKDDILHTLESLMSVILGLSQWFIWMEQSGFNAEQNLNN